MGARINPSPRESKPIGRAKAIKRAPHAAPNLALRRRAFRLEETMKVHHVAPHFHPERGGVEWNVLGLGRYLVDRGHEVVVHTSSRGIRGETFPAIGMIDGIAIRRYRPLIHLGYYATVFRPDVRGADIVHLHGYGFLTNDRAARGLHRTVPFVYSLHHGVSQPPPSLAAALKWKAYYSLQGRATLRRAAAIISGSVPDRDWLASRGFPLERVHVVPTGLDPTAFRPGSPERARSRFRLDRYVLFLGRLHREKSPDHLVRAAADLGDWPGSFVFVGPDGGMRNFLETQASALGLRDRVVFTGEVDEETKRDLLAGATCLVLPSFYEAQGIVILEAWAQGIPVVASRVGGVPHLVSDGVDALLFAWSDVAALSRAIRRIIENPTEAAAMGRAGRAKASSKFTWEILGPQVETIYEAAVRS